MKKILFRAYLEDNLGDDLFALIVLNRYKNDFYIYSKKEYKAFEKTKNLHFKGKKLNILLDRICRGLFNIHGLAEKGAKKDYDLLLYVGGSLFIENDRLDYWKSSTKQYMENYIPYYILGSNVGPYKDEEFLNILRNNVFEHAEDVCFRDEYSYSLFKDLPNVRYASDIVFSLDTSNIKITNNKKAVISVIDCDRKVKKEYKDGYESKIIDMIELLDKKGYEIILMSYCQAEGDEVAIESIIGKIGNEELKNKVNKYYYNGNIEEALNVMGDCQIVVGSRFHANILGLVLGKTIIPIAYSDKTINVLRDMNFKGKVFDVRKLDDFDVETLSEDDLNYKLDVSFQKKDAQRHFEKLDQVLDRKGENE